MAVQSFLSYLHGDTCKYCLVETFIQKISQSIDSRLSLDLGDDKVNNGRENVLNNNQILT